MSTREAPGTSAAGPSARPAPDRVWAVEDVAAYLQCAVRTVQEIRREDASFPEPRHVRSMCRWLPADVEAWFAGLGQARAGTSVAYRRASEQRAVVSKPAVPKAVVPKAAPRAETGTVRRGSAR